MLIKKDYFIRKQWIYTGIGWGIFMFFLATITIPFFFKEPITWKKVLIEFPLWINGGLGYGYFMKKYFEKEKFKKE